MKRTMLLNRRTELIGMRFGKIVVLGPGPVIGKVRRSFWLCKCDCGKTFNTRETRLVDRKRSILSCGCLIGQRVNTNLTVALLRDKWSSAQVWRYYQYQQSAKIRGLEFSIDHETFEIITKLCCHYCGIPPRNIARMPKRDQHRKSERVQRVFKYNGLDRVDNTKGYTFENIVPCCANCNRAKRTMTRLEFLDLISRIYNHSLLSAPSLIHVV